jgi:polyhydroxybutyrate depolymerase
VIASVPSFSGKARPRSPLRLLENPLGILLLLCLAAFPRASNGGPLVPGTLEHGGRTRKYYVLAPSAAPGNRRLPLVIAFHGGKGKAHRFPAFTGLDRIAPARNLLAVFPQGIDGFWYDEAYADAFPDRSGIDDAGFVVRLLERIMDRHPVDPGRVYAVGMSNGGVFCLELARKASEHFAAVAALVAQVPRRAAPAPPPPRPVSVLFLNGTDDPFVPFEGGDIRVKLYPWPGKGAKRGSVLSVEQSVGLWLDYNGISGEPNVRRLPDRDPEDGARAKRFAWKAPSRDVSVVLYKIIGGGHTLPGKEQYLPRRVIGNTCRDFDAFEAVCDFFLRHEKAETPSARE